MRPLRGMLVVGDDVYRAAVDLPQTNNPAGGLLAELRIRRDIHEDDIWGVRVISKLVIKNLSIISAV